MKATTATTKKKKETTATKKPTSKTASKATKSKPAKSEIEQLIDNVIDIHEKVAKKKKAAKPAKVDDSAETEATETEATETEPANESEAIVQEKIQIENLETVEKSEQPEQKEAKGLTLQFLCAYGKIDSYDKAIKAIQFRSADQKIDGKRIDAAATNGLLYLKETGEPLMGITREEGCRAMFKIVPIGYFDSRTGHELCASFIKIKGEWSGIFVGLLYDLIVRAMLQYESISGNPSNELRESISELSWDTKLNGHGFAEILGNNGLKPPLDMRWTTTKSFKPLTTIGDVIKLDPNEFASEEEIAKMPPRKPNPGNEDNTVSDQGLVDVDTESMQVDSGLLGILYDRLLIKENWQSRNNYRLAVYLRALIKKAAFEQTTTQTLSGNGYILSSDRAHCVMNTGLLDTFSNDIYIVDMDVAAVAISTKQLRIMQSKSSLLSLGFDLEVIKTLPKPPRFYKNKSELVFEADLADVDLEDSTRINHIIEERRYRFPLKYATAPTDVLAEKVKSAIAKALRLSTRDYKYIVPMYNLRFHEIQYLMPLHLDASIEEAPELAIIIREQNGFYVVSTILTTEEAYNNARLICRPDSSWLRVK